MRLELALAEAKNIIEGLQQFGDSAFTMGQNLRARTEKPILSYDTNLWRTWLDSRTMQLYGGLNDDGRVRFKIDNNPDLTTIISQPYILTKGSFQIDDEIYARSKGTEFIVIAKKGVKEADANYYAIRADKYQKIRASLNKAQLTAEDLAKAGGFKVNEPLTPNEAKASDGWLEFALSAK